MALSQLPGKLPEEMHSIPSPQDRNCSDFDHDTDRSAPSPASHLLDINHFGKYILVGELAFSHTPDRG